METIRGDTSLASCFLLHFVRSRSRNDAAQYTGRGVLFLANACRGGRNHALTILTSVLQLRVVIFLPNSFSRKLIMRYGRLLGNKFTTE